VTGSSDSTDKRSNGFGNLVIVGSRFAAASALLTLFRAADLCFEVAIGRHPPSSSGPIVGAINGCGLDAAVLPLPYRPREDLQ